MLHFHPDKPLPRERLNRTGLLGTPLILATNLGTRDETHEYVSAISSDAHSVTVHRRALDVDSASPTYQRLTVDTYGREWVLYPSTPSASAVTGKGVTVVAGENPERPDELHLVVETPRGRLVATANPDLDYPEIYLEYRSAAVHETAPDRQVAVLQLAERDDGFRLLVYGDDESDDATQLVEGRQLPSDDERETRSSGREREEK